MKNSPQKQDSSSKTLDIGPEELDPSSVNIPDFEFPDPDNPPKEQVDLRESMHQVMMSDELREELDPDDLYGQADEAHVPEMSPEDTRRPETPTNFRCGVTLADDEERSGDVLSFLRDGVKREVQFLCVSRIADDICSSSILRVRVRAPSGTEVFNVAFDPDEDEFDMPTLGYQLSQLGPVITLSFTVDVLEEDTYDEEDVQDDQSEKA